MEKLFLERRSVQNAILEIFFLIVIFTRWVLPKGKITLEELSKLLLIYISVIADILDMMKMVRNLRRSNCDHELKKQVFEMSLVALSVSILQLCLGLTAKRRSRTTSKDLDLSKLKCHSNKLKKIQENTEEIQEAKNKTSKIKYFLINLGLSFEEFYLRSVNKLKQTFEKEVWGILALLMAKDIPFSFIRTYALIAPSNRQCTIWDQSVFFTLKNYFTIIIQINRCYVLFNLSDEKSNQFEESRINAKYETKSVSKSEYAFFTTTSSGSSFASSSPQVSTVSTGSIYSTRKAFNSLNIDLDAPLTKNNTLNGSNSSFQKKSIRSLFNKNNQVSDDKNSKDNLSWVEKINFR